MNFTRREQLRNGRGHLLGAASGATVILMILMLMFAPGPEPVPSPPELQTSPVNLIWGSPLAEPVETQEPLGEELESVTSEQTPNPQPAEPQPPEPAQAATEPPAETAAPVEPVVAELPRPEANEIEQEIKPVEELTPEQVAETAERYRGRIRQGEWLIYVRLGQLDNEQFDSACLGYAVETVTVWQGRESIKNREYLAGRTLQKGDRGEYDQSVLCGELRVPHWSPRLRACFQTRYGRGANVRASFCLRDEVALEIYRVLLPFIQKHQPGPEHRIVITLASGEAGTIIPARVHLEPAVRQ